MDISIPGNGVLAGVIGILVFVLGLILVMRVLLKGKTDSDLTGKYDGKAFKSIADRTKYPDVNVFKMRSTFLLSGIALSLLLTVLAFAWTNYEETVVIPEGALDYEEEIEMEPPRTNEPPPPPPPPPPPIIEEVPEEMMDEDPPKLPPTDINKDDVVKTPPPPDPGPPPPPPPPPPPKKKKKIFKVVEDMPRFDDDSCEGKPKAERNACSTKKMLEFIYKNIKYPAIARENGVDGTVVINFVVTEKGQIKEAKIVKDIGAGCGDEALRVVGMMPDWVPGQQRGNKVAVYFNLPVKFRLE